MSVTPKTDRDLQQVIQEIIRRVTNLEQANPLQGGVTISGGGLTAVDPNSGHTTFYEGITFLNDGSGRKQMVLYLRRNDGSLALALADLGTVNGHTFQQALAVFDILGNIVVADSIGADGGLARPYIPFGAFVDALVPTATTTSTTFATLQSAIGYRQLPRVWMQVLVYADSGTTGVIQVVDQASNVIGSHTLSSGEYGYVTFGPVAMPGTYLQQVSLNIQGKVLTGAGKVGARGVGAWGVQD